LSAPVSLIEASAQFDLIETMAFDPEIGLPLLDLHLDRLARSADLLGFRLNRHALRNELQAATFGIVEPSRVRLLLGRNGEIAIEVSKALVWPEAVMPVAIVPRGCAADDLRLRHKTTDRRIYQAALAAAGAAEALMIDHEGYLTEGSYWSLFVERDGLLLTPPLARGLLPGVLRQSLIESGVAIEADLTPDDLADGFQIGNAARGLTAAKLVEAGLVAPGG